MHKMSFGSARSRELRGQTDLALSGISRVQAPRRPASSRLSRTTSNGAWRDCTAPKMSELRSTTNAALARPCSNLRARSGRWRSWPRSIPATRHIRRSVHGSRVAGGCPAVAWASRRGNQAFASAKSHCSIGPRSGATDVQFRQELIPAHQALGNLLTSRGQPERGVDELRSAVAEADRLVPVEPANSLLENTGGGCQARTREDAALAWPAVTRHAADERRMRDYRCASSGRRPRQIKTDGVSAQCASRLALQSGALSQALGIRGAIDSHPRRTNAAATPSRIGTRSLQHIDCSAIPEVVRRHADGARAAWAKALQHCRQRRRAASGTG